MNKSIFSLLFLCSLILFQHSLANAPLQNIKALVIWNVGQGSWATKLGDDACSHFDIGGEFANLKRIQNFCSFRKQYLFISHWDWDHFSFLKKFVSENNDICIKSPSPPETSKKAWIQEFLPRLPPCSSQHLQKSVQIIYEPENRMTGPPLRSNDESIIYFSSGFLFPGDSPGHIEKRWKSHLNRQEVKFLLLGHHGSKSSTSEDLLRALPHLRGAIVSSRWGKYGHPHPIVVDRLRKRKIPILQTEKWGNIWYLL
jgi:competence protein ComEC